MEYKAGDKIRIEGLHFDHRGRPKFLKKGKSKGDVLKVIDGSKGSIKHPRIDGGLC